MTTTSVARASRDLALSAAGWCALGLAAAGVFIPGLPTTVFVLVAFYCFSKSSPRVARWLTEHRQLGSTLRPFLAEGGLSRTAKRAALIAMWTSILVSSAVLVRVQVVAALATVALGMAGTMAVHFGVRTVPEHPKVAAAPKREPRLSIALEWTTPWTLRMNVGVGLTWQVTLRSSPMTRLFNSIGSLIPEHVRRTRRCFARWAWRPTLGSARAA